MTCCDLEKVLASIVIREAAKAAWAASRSGGLSDAAAMESDDAGSSAKIVLFDVLNIEPGAFEKLGDWSGQVAADRKRLPDRIEPVLPARHAGFRRQSVLEQKNLSARLEDAPDLPQRLLRIIDGAERVGDHHRVDRCSLERERLGWSADDLERNGAGLLASLAEPEKGLVRVDADHLRDLIRIVERQVQAGPHSNLKHHSTGQWNNPLPLSRNILHGAKAADELGSDVAGIEAHDRSPVRARFGRSLPARIGGRGRRPFC